MSGGSVELLSVSLASRISSHLGLDGVYVCSINNNKTHNAVSHVRKLYIHYISKNPKRALTDTKGALREHIYIGSYNTVVPTNVGTAVTEVTQTDISK